MLTFPSRYNLRVLLFSLQEAIFLFHFAGYVIIIYHGIIALLFIKLWHNYIDNYNYYFTCHQLYKYFIKQIYI